MNGEPVELRCFTCGGSFEAVIKDLSNPDADDFQAAADARLAHAAQHPDSLKVDAPGSFISKRGSL